MGEFRYFLKVVLLIGDGGGYIEGIWSLLFNVIAVYDIRYELGFGIVMVEDF